VKSNTEIKNSAIRTLSLEASALSSLIARLNDDFDQIVEKILTLKGRVIVSGIGKSAIVAQKIVATMNSTGTPAVFLHAADAIHGDLGIVQPDDLIIVLSKSGNTPEIKVLVPLLKQTNNTVVALVGNTQSYLAQQAHYVLDATVEKEACPLDLAPTTSTTAQMALGDALAICLLEQRRFSEQDFARYHPGGALGKRLYLRVSDLSTETRAPQVSPDASIREVIIAITQHRMGAVAVCADQNLMGIITDGDIRRMIEQFEDFNRLKAKDIMGTNPKTIEQDALAVEALTALRKNNITQLLVTQKGEYRGIIHLHDLIREGII
jgi:arabinose-5-phosphate isomerase